MRWRPDPTTPSVPSTPKARAAANIAAIRLLDDLDARDTRTTPVTAEELSTLAAWSGWGAVPQVFDPANTDYAGERAELRGLLSETEWNAAARTTINAHYTDTAYVEAVWSALGELGFTGGRVLEPGCGSGNFIGLAPDAVELTGVEVDPTTARVAARLFPGSDIRAESFADTRVTGRFDAVVGNVPFSDGRLTDRVHNAGRHSMHNHFLIKSLALTKPGGLVAALTSRYTLDTQNPAARRELAELGDLVGAVRLPTAAHRRTAGTDVVTDLVILRRREPGRGPAPDTMRWLDATTAIDIAGEQGPVTFRINPYFVDHPEHVLGELGVGRGPYGEELVVDGNGDTAQALARALDQVVAAARARGLVWSADRHGEEAVARPAAQLGAAPETYAGYLVQTGPREFAAVNSDGGTDPVKVPATQVGELADLLRLRDTVTALLEAEAATLDDTAEIEQLRADLNREYDSYVAVHGGPLNRFAEKHWVDKHGNDRVTPLRPPVMRIFGSDPFSPIVFALEDFNAEHQVADKADVMQQRVVAPRRPVLGADTPADAVAISVDTHGQARLDYIAELLGIDEAEAREAVRGLVYDEPGTRRIVPAAEYLSGNVRRKLASAVAAAAEDEAYQENVTALREVLPRDLMPADITVHLGAAWIGPDDVQAFLREILNDRTISVERVVGAQWKVEGGKNGVTSTSQWGTARMPAGALAEHVLRQATIRIFDVVDDGHHQRRVYNAVETEAAKEKAAALAERFATWVWEVPERADRLARDYNESFNSLVLRTYDTDNMSLPGLVETFDPHPHQLAAVARMVAEPTVGLFHEVGAGKTAEMVMGVSELRRLGLVRKPAIVVPNHMLEQFSREYLQLYPRARILAAGTEDLAGDKRRAFVARVATGNWDTVILTRTAFEKLPVSKETLASYLEHEITPLRAALQKGGRSVKRIEKAIAAAEERIKDKLDAFKDPGPTFEQTGIDYLCVDELHDYKNLLTPSSIQGAGITSAANRATDLHMKVEYLRQRYNGRAFTGATATPIANSLAEAYVMQRYLRPDLLRDAGIPDFDTWIGTFGEVHTNIEVSPDSNTWQVKTRLKFCNVPELQRIWHVAADVKTAKDLEHIVKTPDLVQREDGKRLPQTIVIEPSDELLDFVHTLGDRAEQIRQRMVDPQQDNMLKVTGEGRAAAIDLRLLKDQPAPGSGTAYESLDLPISLVDLAELHATASNINKVDTVAATVAQRWASNKDRVYDTKPGSGEPHPTPGALQLVFCDLGTPSDNWNVYDELKDQLVARGVPAGQIAFMHSAKNDRQKAALFEAARTGQVQVLLGSTSKMGIGTNVQNRAIALHHVDCPWRPADIVQRDGRGLRQGNQNPEIEILRYVTKQTFDTYSWQTVERKAKFIAQFMTGRIEQREIEDIGDVALSATEVKALASGNPLLMEKAAADAEVARLVRLETSHNQTQTMLQHRIHSHHKTIDDARSRIGALEDAIARRSDTRGDHFRMQVAGTWYDDRGRAAAALTAELSTLLNASGYQRPQKIGHLGGFDFTAERDYNDGSPYAILRASEAPIRSVNLTLTETETPAPGLIVRIENVVRALDRQLSDERDRVEELTAEIGRAQEQLGQPFKHREALHKAYEARKAVNDQLADQAASKPAPAAAGAPDVADSLALLASTHPGRGVQNHSATSTTVQASARTPEPTHDSSTGLD